MGWWLRIITTVVLTPLLWGLIGAYADGSLGMALTTPFLGTLQFFTLLFTGQFAAIPAHLSTGLSILLDALAQVPALLAPLWPIYLGATLPVLALVVLILMPAEYSLRRLGLDLLTVLVLPVIAYFFTFAVARFVPDPPSELLFDTLWLTTLYGLVFALTIREPRRLRRRAPRTRAAG